VGRNDKQYLEGLKKFYSAIRLSLNVIFCEGGMSIFGRNASRDVSMRMVKVVTLFWDDSELRRK